MDTKIKTIEKFRDEIKSLLDKPEYQTIAASVVVLDFHELETAIIGNLCPLCALETMDEIVVNSGLTHNHMEIVDKVEKLKVN